METTEIKKQDREIKDVYKMLLGYTQRCAPVLEAETRCEKYKQCFAR
jgi:hypothetical protein